MTTLIQVCALANGYIVGKNNGKFFQWKSIQLSIFERLVLRAISLQIHMHSQKCIFFYKFVILDQAAKLLFAFIKE